MKMYPSQMSSSSILILLLTSITPTYAQQAADGALVPFTSVLPACASKCGPLYDVQGGCTTQACFCADARLKTIGTTGDAAVATICGAGSCTAAADQQKVVGWYKGFCPSNAGTAPTTATGGAPGATSTGGVIAPTGTTGTGSSGGSTAGSGTTGNEVVKHGSWFSTHWQWVVMLIVIIFAIVGGWIGACIWRRAYLRKKERQYEMRPPAVPWAPAGPEQHMTGGLQRVYGPGVGMSGGAGAGGHQKEMRSAVNTPSPLSKTNAADPEKGGVRGFLRKARG